MMHFPNINERERERAVALKLTHQKLYNLETNFKIEILSSLRKLKM